MSKQKNGLHQVGKVWHGAFRYEKADGTRDRWRGSLDTETKSVALQRLQAKRQELTSAKWGEQGAFTFDQALEKYMVEYMPNLRSSTQKEYSCALIPCLEFLSGKRLVDITRATIFELERYLAARPSKDKNGKNIVLRRSKPRIRRVISYLASLFGFAVEKGMLEHSVLVGYLKMRAKQGLKEGAPRTRYADHGERERLFAAADSYVSRFTKSTIDDVVRTYVYTGMRQAEAYNFQWSWVNDKLNVIIVPPLFGGGGDEGTKSGKERRIPILPEMRAVLDGIERHKKSPYVFWRLNGQKYDNWDKAFRSVCKLAKITPHLTEHDLRRTYGCMMLQDYKLSIESVSKLLGHSDIGVTQRHYAFLNVEHVQDEIDVALSKRKIKLAT